MFVLNTMAKADVGQSVVVQEGVVIAIEAAEGTAEMLKRAKGLKLKDKPGVVLVKLIKVGQDEAIDLPTIGSRTVNEVLEAKLSGIAVGANTTQIIDNEKTIALANEHGIFIMGV